MQVTQIEKRIGPAGMAFENVQLCQMTFTNFYYLLLALIWRNLLPYTTFYNPGSTLMKQQGYRLIYSG